MKTAATLLISLVLCASLSGCFFLAGAAAGAGGAVVYKDEEQKKQSDGQ